jgi:hypothetical protein
MSFNYGEEEAWDVSTDQFLGVGTHLITVVEADKGWTKGDSFKAPKPQIEIKVQNDQGTRRDWIVITPKTVGKVVQIFDATGAQRPQQGEFNPETGELTEECVARLRGRKCGVVIRLETSLKDPMKEEPRIAGYIESQRVTDDIPADTRGLPSADPAQQAPSASRPPSENKSSIPF